MKKMIIPTLIIFGFLLPGCVTMTDKDRTKAGGVLVGAAVGAAAGQALGRDTKGTLIGAAVGAAIGGVVGNEVAKRKAQYASREDFLAAEIKNVANYNQTIQAHNEQLRVDIARMSREAEMLRTAHLQEKNRQELLASRRAELANRLQKNREIEKAMAEELTIQKAILLDGRKSAAAGDPQIYQLEQEISFLEQNIKELQEGSTQLAMIEERLII